MLPDQKRTVNQTEIDLQLQMRAKFQVQTLLGRNGTGKLILTTPCDEGVARNGGRRGSRFGPESIINILKKMNLPSGLNNQSGLLIENLQDFATFKQTGTSDFTTWQKELITSKLSALKNKHANGQPLIHLGGGHDSIYPMLMAWQQLHKKPMTIINIDAHLDTRTDHLFHSGTPFRQLAFDSKMLFHLWQVGIRSWANQSDNYDKLPPNAVMNLISVEKLETITIQDDHLLILSLDADGLDGSVMPAVSAVNADGLSKQKMQIVLDWFFKQKNPQKMLGLYEYNPIYDDLSSKGARYLASLCYRFLFEA